MAEVTGIFGSEQIELNNAATEATLKQLLSATLLMATKTGKGSNAHKELEKLANATKDSTKKLKENNSNSAKKAAADKEAREAQNAYTEAQERSRKQTVTVLKGLDNFARGTVSAANKLTSMVNSIANMGNSFSGAAGVLGQVPIVGGLIGPVFSAIGAAGDKVFNSFQQAASVGASFNGSLITMVKSASDVGMAFDQFSGLLAKNGENLRLLGGSTDEGAKRLTALGKSIRKSPLGEGLARLGISTEAINQGMLDYSALMKRSGVDLKNKDHQLISGSARYLKELDAISKLTGKKREELQAETDARLRIAGIRALSARAGKDSENVMTFLNSLPKELQPGAQDVLMGKVHTDAAKHFQLTANKTAADVYRAGAGIRDGLGFSKEAGDKLRSDMVKESTIFLNSAPGKTMATFVDGMNDHIVGLYDLTTQEKDIAKIRNKQNKDMQSGKAPDDDPAALQKAQQKLAEQSNNMTLALIKHLPKLTEAFDMLTEYIEGPLKTAFDGMMKHFKLITGVVAGLVLITGGITLAAKGKELFDLFSGSKNTAPGGGTSVATNAGGRRSRSSAGKGVADLGKGAGKGIADLGKGIGSGLGGILQGLAKGIMAFANPLVVIGAAGLGAAILLIGGAIAGATWMVGKALPTMANGMKSFEELNGQKLIDAGLGMLSIAAGMAAFGAGSAVAGLGSLVGGVTQGIAKLFGAEDPMTKLQKFSEYNINGAKVKTNAEALVAFSKAMASAGGGSAIGGLGNALGTIGDSISKFFGGETPFEKVKKFGDLNLNAAGVTRNAKAITEMYTALGMMNVRKSTKPVAAIPAPPKVADVAITQKEMVAAATAAKTKTAGATDKLSEQMKASSKDLLSTGVTEIKPSKPLTGQETPEQLLASLNTKMENIVRLNTKFVELASRQLSVQQGLSGNLLRSV